MWNWFDYTLALQLSQQYMMKSSALICNSKAQGLIGRSSLTDIQINLHRERHQSIGVIGWLLSSTPIRHVTNILHIFIGGLLSDFSPDAPDATWLDCEHTVRCAFHKCSTPNRHAYTSICDYWIILTNKRLEEQ